MVMLRIKKEKFILVSFYAKSTYFIKKIMFCFFFQVLYNNSYIIISCDGFKFLKSTVYYYIINQTTYTNCKHL